MGDRNDSYENGRHDSYQSDSRSPPYEDQYGDRRYDERLGLGARKAEFDRGRYDDKGYDNRPSRYSNDEKGSPGQFGNGSLNKRFEDRRFLDAPNRHRREERSPNYQRDFDICRPPPVRPMRDILGDDVPTLHRIASSSSMGSVDGNSPTLKRVNSGSLIDFSAEPEHPSAAAQQDLFARAPTMVPTGPVPRPSAVILDAFGQANNVGQLSGQWASGQQLQAEAQGPMEEFSGSTRCSICSCNALRARILQGEGFLIYYQDSGQNSNLNNPIVILTTREAIPAVRISSLTQQIDCFSFEAEGIMKSVLFQF
eukprot:Gb_08798 [translate_table: standard]